MRQVWHYKARDVSGNATTGEMDGEDRDYIGQALMERGLIPISIKKKSDRSLGNIMSSFGSADREKLIIFTKKLKTLYLAGIPLLRSLDIIGRGAAELGMVEEIKGIKSALQSGQSLSGALSRFPKKFPLIYVNSIAAGEASGTMDEVLDQMATLVEKELALSRQIKSAVRYPIMVIGIIGVAVFVLMTFVVPKFTAIYGRFGAELPLPTKIVIGVSDFMSGYWYVILAFLAVFSIGFRKYVSTPKGRRTWDGFTMSIPKLGDLVVKANIARFAAMLNILFHSGVPMISCLKILRETAQNKVIADEIGMMQKSFEEGREVGSELENYKYIPDMTLEMLEVGLESGSVEMIMQELANHYEMELDYKSRNLTAVLEPVLTLVIAVMVLILALAIFLPMWNLITVFQ